MRWLGVLPIGFFALAVATYARGGTTWEALWICNLANLLLGIGMLVESAPLVWIATLWILAGTPLWIWDVVRARALNPHSIGTHFVAAILGVIGLRRMPRVERAWLYAVGFGLGAQLASRALTPAALNINVAHAPYEGLGGLVANYPLYFALNGVLLAGALFVEERALVALTRPVAARPPSPPP